MITKWQEIDIPGIKEIIEMYYWDHKDWMEDKVLEFQILPGIMFSHCTRVFFGLNLNYIDFEEYISTTSYTPREHDSRKSGLDICILDDGEISISTLGFPDSAAMSHYELTMYSYFGEEMSDSLRFILMSLPGSKSPGFSLRTPVWFNKAHGFYIPIRSDGRGQGLCDNSCVRLRVMSRKDWIEAVQYYIWSKNKSLPDSFTKDDLTKDMIKLVND